jgi:hypothetical protein
MLDENYKGVLYYNRGTKCVVRLLLSLYSLRKVYNGNITVVCEGKQSDGFINALEGNRVNIVNIPETGQYALCTKPTLHKYSPYELTMFMDADTLVVNPINEYFTYIAEFGFVVGHFDNWKTTGRQIKRRIDGWAKAVPEMVQPALDYGSAINTGIVGWRRNDPALKRWHEVCQKGYAQNCTTRVVDELAAQMILPEVKHKLVGMEWGVSGKFGKVTEDTKIIHYHGNKHVGPYENCKHWKSMYHEAIKEGGIPEDHYGDQSLIKYLKEEGIMEQKYPLTIVTAVNKKYLRKFKNNVPKWLEVSTLRNHKWIIFAHKDCVEKVCEFMQDVIGLPDDVDIVDWEFPKAEWMREEMLSCFVFGVAQHVKTKFWAKLDCDCKPTGTPLVLDDTVWRHTLTGHKWGYTKMKGDGQDVSNGHWLNTLDDWADSLSDFKGTERTFPDKITTARHNHARICTFFAIEKTGWTKHLADMCKRTGGRMPIPSQDTLSHYCVNRLGNGRTVNRVNFKQFFKP